MNITRRLRFYFIICLAAVLYPTVYVSYMLTKNMYFLITLVVMIVVFMVCIAIEWRKGNIPLSRKQRKQPWWIIFLFAVIEFLFAFGNVLAPFIPVDTNTWQSFITMFLLIGGMLGICVWLLLATREYIRDEE